MVYNIVQMNKEIAMGTQDQDVEAMTEQEINVALERANRRAAALQEKIAEDTLELDQQCRYADELRAELKRIYAAGEGENS